MTSLDAIESALDASMFQTPEEFPKDIDISNCFECGMPVEQSYPDNIAQWPQDYVAITDEAIARLLQDHPGKKVVEDKATCISSDHPRFPNLDDLLNKRLNFYLRRSVLLGDA